MFRALLLSLSLFIFGCKSIAPTPILISDLVQSNNEVHTLYKAYSDCHSDADAVCNLSPLLEKIRDTQSKAKFFIGGDITQPHGYDIYLQVALIYFSVSEANKNELTEAERISRQFFEVQKASSGRGLQQARYYWALTLAEELSHDWRSGDRERIGERKADILLCLSEATLALEKIGPGEKSVRLFQAISILASILNSL